MNYLLDTHAFLWWLSNSDKLGKSAREVISDPENRIFVSHATQWEISIKVAIGRLVFPLNSLAREVEDNSFEVLSINTQHIVESANLPMIHRDPFDRMLIAQSKIESLVLISKDNEIKAYDIELLW